jgi:hypothetical protein
MIGNEEIQNQHYVATPPAAVNDHYANQTQVFELESVRVMYTQCRLENHLKTVQTLGSALASQRWVARSTHPEF